MQFFSQYHFYSGMAGAQIGGILVFPSIKITVICPMRMYCGLSVKIDMCEMPNSAQRSRTHFVCVCFHMCGQQKPKHPKLKLHG